MTAGQVVYREIKDLPEKDLYRLYRENQWVALASEPERLRRALRGSHRVISAWEGTTLVGLGNALSDGLSVVFYSHLLVLPSHQRMGISSTILSKLRYPYEHFQQQILITDEEVTGFYRKHGFAPVSGDKAIGVEAMWIHRR